MTIKNLLILFLLFFVFVLQAQIKICSWNIANFGKSKTPATLVFIANTIKDYDVIAVQEVVAGYGGAQAVAKLANELNQTGSKWDYCVSDPTTSSAYKTERYAFLWKTSKIKKIGKAWLEQKYNLEIEREPYLCTFQYADKQFTLASFHAITKNKQPETEIKYFKFLPKEYPNLNLIFAGDFNCPQSHNVFGPLRNLGFKNAFVNQKTSLKNACKNNNCLASEFDNIWFDTKKIKLLAATPIYFYTNYKTLKEAKTISDHIPVVAEIDFLKI
jgi:endonuclease/exonuclease/phosphatase family metal-dependent hydrolase